MNKLKDVMGDVLKHKFIRLCVVGLIFYGIYVLVNSGPFQKIVFPKTYWRKQVSALEWKIQHDGYQLRNAQREITKIRLTSNVDMVDSIDIAETFGFDTKEAREEFINDTDNKNKILQSIIGSYNESLIVDRKKLEIARSELSKYDS